MTNMTNEEKLRLAYWEDRRSDPRFPLWVIFRRIGQSPAAHSGLPYVRPGGPDLPDLLKRLEQWPDLPQLASYLNIPPDDLRAVLWFLTWKAEHTPADAEWADWNARVDEAWASGRATPPSG